MYIGEGGAIPRPHTFCEPHRAKFRGGEIWNRNLPFQSTTFVCHALLKFRARNFLSKVGYLL